MEAKRVLSHVRSLLVVSYQATCLLCWAFVYMLSYQSWFCVSRGKAWTSIQQQSSVTGPALWFANGESSQRATSADRLSCAALGSGHWCWTWVSTAPFRHCLLLKVIRAHIQRQIYSPCSLSFASYIVLIILQCYLFWMIETPWVGRKVETGIQDFWLGSLCK